MLPSSFSLKISWLHIMLFLALFLFVSSASFFLGVYTERERFMNQTSEMPIITNFGENTSTTPVINLNQIENGILEINKKNNAEIRIMLDNNPQTLQVFEKNTEKLYFNVIEILPKIDKVPAPRWAKFVGSKRGSTFWPLDHPRAFILTPKNRIFFKNKEDAFAKKYKYGVK